MPTVKQHATGKAEIQTQGCAYSYTVGVRHYAKGHTAMISNYHHDTAREVLVSFFFIAVANEAQRS